MVERSTAWSLYAGGSAFLCSIVLLVPLSPLGNTLVKVLALPTEYSTVLLAAPVPVIGVAAWWILVERRAAYGYGTGAAYGLTVALSTVLFWVLVFAAVWGPSLVLVGGVLVAFTLAVTVPAALVAGMALTFVRRHLDGALPGGRDRAPQ